MKITILTYGSRGDVQPFRPFSLELMERVYSVRLPAPQRFKNLVEGHGIEFAPLADDPEDLSRRLNDSGHNFIKLMGEIISHALKIAADVARQTEMYGEDADLIVHAFLHAVNGHTLARKRNVPDVHIQTFPMFAPTGDYPNITLSSLGFPALNRLTHVVASKVTWMTSRWGFEYIRRCAGLPKQKPYWPFDQDPLRPRTPVLCAWSPSLLPPSNDWRSNVHVTGYFFSSINTMYRPPVELHHFLNTGDPPVCISFGSMIHREAEKIDRIVREALAQTGQRGVILSGWGRVNQPSWKDLLYLDSVRHGWLLPHCKMIVQHGGAGTTSASRQNNRFGEIESKLWARAPSPSW